MPSQEKSERQDARERLLEAAVRLFADRGYAGTSVRQLGEAAGVNPALVNYYFGTKEELYDQALRRAFLPVRDALPAARAILEGSRSTGTAEAARDGVRSFVLEFMRALVPVGESGAHARLLARELSAPSAAIDRIFTEFISPRNAALVDLLRQLRPDLSDRDLQLAASSIFGQCVFYQMATPVALRLLKRRTMTARLLEEAAAHIADFSLRALEPAGKG